MALPASELKMRRNAFALEVHDTLDKVRFEERYCSSGFNL